MQLEQWATELTCLKDDRLRLTVGEVLSGLARTKTTWMSL